MAKKECAREGCELKPWDADGNCILHSPDPGKDPQLFERTLEEKIRREENDPGVEIVNLDGVVFPVEVKWGGRVFKKSVSFEKARFLKAALFLDAQFSGAADFFHAQFSGEAFFSHAQFSGEANFSSARFSGVAHFFGAQFSGAAHFFGAQFSGEAIFISAQFSGEAIFISARFSGLANFSDANFSRRADFGQAIFQNRLRFRKTAFPTQKDKEMVDFQDVTLVEPDKVFFEHVDLSRASFLYTDMSHVHLTDITWPTAEERRLGWLPFFREKVFTLYDHKALIEERKAAKVKSRPAEKGEGAEEEHEKEREGNPYRLVENLYRQLRVNLESRKQDIEAGDFHIGEMEMRRLNRDTPLAYRWHLWVYRYLALYGERYSRPLFYWVVLGLLAFAPLYMLSGFKALGGQEVHYKWFAWELQAWQTFFDHYKLALANALSVPPLPPVDFQPLNGCTALLRLFNSLVNVFLIGLALIALRRRFKR